jgi:hypothetical protein
MTFVAKTVGYPCSLDLFIYFLFAVRVLCVFEQYVYSTNNKKKKKKKKKNNLENLLHQGKGLGV